MAAHPSPRKVNLVGSRIRELRKGRHLTQTELSEKIGVAQSDLSRMEQGEYKVGLDTLFKILQVFELSMSHFFEEPADEVAALAPAPTGDHRRPARWSRTATGSSPKRRGRKSAISFASRGCRKRHASRAPTRARKKSEGEPLEAYNRPSLFRTGWE